MDKAKARVESGLVQSLTRGMSLLEVLSEREHGLRLKDLARQADLSPSTAHRLLTTLEQKRFVRFDRDSCVWTIGSSCFAAGSGFLRQQQFMVEAASRLRFLSNEIKETTSLGVMEGGKMLVLKQVSGRQVAASLLTPGTRSSPHNTALGKVLLASRQHQQQRTMVLSGRLDRTTERTIINPAALARELEITETRGFAVDDEEYVVGRRCIAAPIYDELGQCVAAISICGMKNEIADAQLPQLAAIVGRAALDITRASGGYSPR